MKRGQFVKGMLAGMAAGTALGMALASRKRTSKSMAAKFLKAAGDIVENLSDVMGG